MVVVKFNGTTNYRASNVTQRTQARTVFANSLVNQKSLDLPCQNRVAAGPAPTTSFSASKIMEQHVGAVATTPAEAALIVQQSPCKQS